MSDINAKAEAAAREWLPFAPHMGTAECSQRRMDRARLAAIITSHFTPLVVAGGKLEDVLKSWGGYANHRADSAWLSDRNMAIAAWTAAKDATP
jgi:hypothetical protein